MKTCPFCVEEIQDEAIKCKHCHEFLDGRNRPAPPLQGRAALWYFRSSFIVLAICCVGPFALPLIWWRPKTSIAWKIGLTLIILVLSWVLFKTTMKSFEALKSCYELIEGL